MALTKVSTDGVKDDAITSGKIPANAVGASELADNAVDTNAIANNAVTAGKTSGVQTTINNNADNRVITGSGTANTLNGESGLTFDGTDVVAIGTATSGSYDGNQKLRIGRASDCNIAIRTTGNTTAHTGISFGDNDSNEAGFIKYYHTNDSLRIQTNNSERLRIQSNGDVYLNPTQGSTGVNSGAIRRFNAGLDYWSGTAGSANAIKYAAHGQSDDNMYGMGISNSLLELQSQVDIGFFAGSAGGGTGRRVERARILSGGGITFNGDTAAANALDDYEEGTWTPTVNNGFSGISHVAQRGWYVRIGVLVHVSFFLRFSAAGASTHMRFSGLPYTSANLSPSYSSGGNVTYTNIPGIDSSSNAGNQSIWIGNNSSIFELYNNGNSSSATGSGGFSNKDIYAHLTYRVG